jgi:hypothetical protein
MYSGEVSRSKGKICIDQVAIVRGIQSAGAPVHTRGSGAET